MSNILVSLDESGDPGSITKGGSSPLFVVGLAVFTTEGSAASTEARIQRLREELRRPQQEFRYARNNQQSRSAFVAATANSPFTYYAAVLSKGKNQRESGADLFMTACIQALTLLAPVLQQEAQVTVVYDETTRERKVLRQFESELRKSVNNTTGRDLIRNVTPRNSSASDIVQLADYVSGIISRSERNDPAAITFRQQWAKREGELWHGSA